MRLQSPITAIALSYLTTGAEHALQKKMLGELERPITEFGDNEGHISSNLWH